MKKIFTFLFVAVLAGFPVYLNLTHQNDQFDLFFKIVIVVLLPLFIFNLIARKYLVFKPYFTSPLNVLNAYKKETFEYKLSKDLMFNKLIESVNDSKLNLKQVDSKKGIILATTSLSFASWGENLYITLNQKDNYTEVVLEMTTISQVYDWGRNQANYKSILNQFEESLVI